MGDWLMRTVLLFGCSAINNLLLRLPDEQR